MFQTMLATNVATTALRAVKSEMNTTAEPAVMISSHTTAV